MKKNVLFITTSFVAVISLLFVFYSNKKIDSKEINSILGEWTDSQFNEKLILRKEKGKLVIYENNKDRIVLKLKKVTPKKIILWKRNKGFYLWVTIILIDDSHIIICKATDTGAYPPLDLFR